MQPKYNLILLTESSKSIRGKMKQEKRVTTRVVVCGIPHVVTDTDENNDFLNSFNNLNITATEQDIDEFVAIGNESTHVFQKEILQKANLF